MGGGSSGNVGSSGSKVNMAWVNVLGLPGLGVHYKGYGVEFDEEMLPIDVERRIQVSRYAY